MHGLFLDTYIFLRHLLNDLPDQSAACRELIRSIEEGRTVAWTTDLVIAEIVFVLSNPNTYGVGRAGIRDLLLPLVSLQGLKIERKRLYPRVFDLYLSHPIDYVDAYHAALIESTQQSQLYSYDTHFDAIGGLTRREPAV